MTLFSFAAAGFLILGSTRRQEAEPLEQKQIYDFTMQTIDGEQRSLSVYKGKVLLIVNVASKCGYTPQYEGLQSLYEKYKDSGLVVLGFPSNNFLSQEPGSDDEIKQFCSTTYGVSFDMFSKIDVKGSEQHPLYRFITTQPAVEGPVKWNFQKYLVGRRGEVKAKFFSKTEPLDPGFTAQIEDLLNEAE